MFKVTSVSARWRVPYAVTQLFNAVEENLRGMNDRKNERKKERMKDTHSGFLILDMGHKLSILIVSIG